MKFKITKCQLGAEVKHSVLSLSQVVKVIREGKTRQGVVVKQGNWPSSHWVVYKSEDLLNPVIKIFIAIV